MPRAQAVVRNRAWCYTINNPTDEEVMKLERLGALRHVCGREVGESGTPHLQGYVRFEQPCAFSWWRNQFPRAHVEIRRGTEHQAVEYCKKDGQLVVDLGQDEPDYTPVDSSGSKRNRETEEVLQEIDAGWNAYQIRQKHPAFFFHNMQKIGWYSRYAKRFRREEYDIITHVSDKDV